MGLKIPTCKKCCLCLPLRYGLLTWGYFRLILASLLLIGLSFVLYRYIIMYASKDGYGMTSFDIVTFSIAIPVLVADIVIGILFVIGGHKKNPKLLTNYFYFSIFMVAMLVPLCLYNIATSIQYLLESKPPFSFIVAFVMLDLVALIAYIVIQIYIILLTRSEILKLNNNRQFQFENNAAEAELSLHNMDSDGQKEIEENNATIDKDGVMTAEVKIGMTK